MTRSALPIGLVAALLGLAACATQDDTVASEDIQWNSPRPETSPPPPAPPQARAPAGGPECREYQTTVTIDGKPQEAYGKACRQPDGTWKEQGVHSKPPIPGAKVEQSYPYGWNGYDWPSGPRYGGAGMSVGVGGGSRGGWFGYGVGF